MLKHPHLVAVAVFILLLGIGFFLAKNFNEWQNAIAFLPTELQSATAIEAYFQNLYEAPHTPESLKIPIFIYHSVRPDFPGESKIQHEYSITPQLLEQQLTYLKDNGYTVISLDQLATDLENGMISPIAKPVVLTFDDGLDSQYKYAFPLLKKYHDTATFYIYTNPIGKKHFMTWDEIKEMDVMGMTIADHTLSHQYLKTLPLDKLKVEVTESKKIIEEHLGKPVLNFASPFGYTNPDIQAILKAAGYVTARTTYKGIYHTKDDMLKLRGILVSNKFDDFVNTLNLQ